MYVLVAAADMYVSQGSYNLGDCQNVIRVLTELAYFDPEKREVHIQMDFRELEAFTQALFDVMLIGFRPQSKHSFEKSLENPGVKILINK